jgi:hypothetical protein
MFPINAPWQRGTIAGLLLAGAVRALAEQITVVPVFEEPLHVVKHRGEHFVVYTNWLEPDVWTLYHEHRYDLLSVIAADVVALNQSPGARPREQFAPAGSMVFFPYADYPEPGIHRVGVSGEGPFINVGIEFRDPISASCEADTETWQAAGVTATAVNRRGHGYRVSISAGAEVALPKTGRGLLLVPLGDNELRVDGDPWTPKPGDFRFYDLRRPAGLGNGSNATAELIVFNAC